MSAGVVLAIIITVGTLNVACFFIGAKVGQAVSKGETIQAPNLDPIKIIKDHRSEREAERQQRRDDVIWRNCDRYDGTPFGQEEVPRG